MSSGGHASRGFNKVNLTKTTTTTKTKLKRTANLIEDCRDCCPSTVFVFSSLPKVEMPSVIAPTNPRNLKMKKPEMIARLQANAAMAGVKFTCRPCSETFTFEQSEVQTLATPKTP